MSNELVLQVITGIYVACNTVRLLSYVPQIVAVARENSGAHAISLVTWLFWTLSNATTGGLLLDRRSTIHCSPA